MRTISRHVNNLYLYFGYWAFAQHCCSVFSIYSTNLIFTFLAIATPASSLLKLLFKTLISTTRDVTRDDIAIWHLQNHVNQIKLVQFIQFLQRHYVPFQSVFCNSGENIKLNTEKLTSEVLISFLCSNKTSEYHCSQHLAHSQKRAGVSLSPFPLSLHGM